MNRSGLLGMNEMTLTVLMSHLLLNTRMWAQSFTF